jgi:hypothetical protein
MISYIWNKIKNIFKPKRQESVVLQKEVKPKLDPCSKHIYYRKSCLVCRELRQAGVI